MAVGAGTQVALEAADMVLIRDDLHAVLLALDLARAVFLRIKLNYVWALAYNLFGVPTAMGLVLPVEHGFHMRPEVAAACMAFSSIAVVLSSLALNLYKPPPLGGRRGASGRGSGGGALAGTGVLGDFADAVGLSAVVGWVSDRIDAASASRGGRYKRVDAFDEEDAVLNAGLVGNGPRLYGAAVKAASHDENPFFDEW